MKKRLDALRKKEKRLIIGMETGSAPGKLGAVLVEVSGSGDETVLAVLGFESRGVNRDLQAALGALERKEKFSSDELAGINFLVLHDLTKLYDEVLAVADAAGEEIDIIGLKCLEIGPHAFPEDPAGLSEMTDRVVASRFRIGTDDPAGDFLAVREPLLKGIVSGMIERFAVGDEAREAVTVALLTNEAIFSDGTIIGRAPSAAAKKGAGKASAAKTLRSPVADGRSCLCGEFFFPR